MTLTPSAFNIVIASTGLFLFLLVGDYTILSIPIGPLSFVISFLIGVSQSCNGSFCQLRLASTSSFLLILLSSINWSLNTIYFQSNNSLLVSIFLICSSPLIGWAYLNFNAINLSKRNLFALNLMFTLEYIFIDSLAGRNISYRFAVFCLFISIYFFVRSFEQRSAYKILWWMNAMYPIIFLYLLVHDGSRGGIFVALCMLTIWLLSIVKIRFTVISKLLTLKVKTIRNFILLIASLLLLPIIVKTVNARAYLFFTYFINPQAVVAISGGTAKREEWYEHLFNLNSMFGSSIFSPEKVPLWGRYPHNFILDSLGNLGLLFMLLSLLGSILILLKFYTSISINKNNDGGLSLSALSLLIIVVSSLISGTLWDYFSIFAGLAFLPISFTSAKPAPVKCQ